MGSDKQLSPVGGSSIPVPNRMLRRLKNATSISDLCPGSEILGSGEADGEDLGKPGLQSTKSFDGIEEEDGMGSDLEGLGVEDRINARKALDFDSVSEPNPEIVDSGEKSEEVSDSETREEIRAPESSVPDMINSAEEKKGIVGRLDKPS